MSLKDRHSMILDILRKEKSMTVSALATLMAVSEVTIRKDLSYLEEQGLLYRAYGCAILINPTINDRHINEKESLNADQKEQIARVAASMVEPNDTIIIASGTTMSYLARAIEPQGRLTVITASVPVATIMARHDNVDVIQLGGIMRHSSLSVVGNFAESMIGSFSCSKLFLGVDGIDYDFGLSTTNMPEATLNQRMMQAAQKTVVLCDSSKFGLRGLSKICNIKDVDQVVTDQGASPQYIEHLRNLGMDVVLS